jgi:hypothetical protein
MKFAVTMFAVLGIGGLSAMNAMPTQAGPVFTANGGEFFTDRDNDFLWLTPRFGSGGEAVRIWQGGELMLSAPGMITLEYIGKEAKYVDDAFLWGASSGGQTVFTTGPASPNPVGQTAATPMPPTALDVWVVPGVVAAGGLPFSFFVSQAGRSEPNGSSNIGFWPLPVGGGLGGEAKQFGTVVYALLDDGKTDNDYDDMIVRLTVAEVPEPTSLAMAAMGMLPVAGWMIRGRRRRRCSQTAGGQEPAGSNELKVGAT